MALTDNIPDIGIGMPDIVNLVTIIIVAVLVGTIVLVISVLIVLRMRFRNKIVIFEKINNRFEPTKKDRAMIMNLKGTGDTVLYLKKHRKWLPTPELQTGRNVYWYAIREDGEWFNIGIEDIDEKFREVGARFLHKEMRYARTSLQSKIQERYDKPKFWQQYGSLIINIAAITIIMVFLWLIVDKLIDLSSATNAGVEAAREVLEETKRILGVVDNIKGGSGIAPADG